VLNANHATINQAILKSATPLLRGVGVCYSNGLTSQQTRSFQDDKMNSK